MNDLHEMLTNISDSYSDFVSFVERRCEEDSDIKAAVVYTITKNENISTDDVLEIYSSVRFGKMGFILNSVKQVMALAKNYVYMF